MNQSLKTIIAAKVILVAVVLVWIYAGDSISISEMVARAKEEVKEATAPPDGENKAKKDEAKVGEENAKVEEQPKRRSFMADLFELPDPKPEMNKDEAQKYLTIIEQRRRQIEERMNVLAQREQQLVGLEASIDGKLKQLEEERRYFGETIQKEKEIGAERTKELVEFYKKMAPKKAAPVFEKLDKDLVVVLFKELPEKQITSILSIMDAEKSKELTEYYSRIRSGKEYNLLKEMNQSLTKEFADCKGMPKDSTETAH